MYSLLVFTDASIRQIGSIIAQKTNEGFKTLAFFAMKMTPAQQKYTVMEQELLAIVMTLRKYRTMMYGYPINIYTDHNFYRIVLVGPAPGPAVFMEKTRHNAILACR